MLYSKELLIELVKINMEEGFADKGVETIEGTTLDSYIESKLPEVMAQVYLTSPAILLPQVDASALLKPVKHQNGSGEITLPKDMLRFTRLKMKGWDKAVTKMQDPSSTTAKLQENPYTMAGRAKPVVVMTNAGNGDKILRYYSLPPEVRRHEIEEALYVKVPDLSTPVEISEYLLPSITYLTASVVFEILGDAQRATLMRMRLAE